MEEADVAQAPIHVINLFMNGAMTPDSSAAGQALAEDLGRPPGLTTEAAAAVMAFATEKVVPAI